MSDTFTRVFKHGKDHNKWDKQIEYATQTPDVSEKVRNEWIKTLEFFRDELGKGFIKSCARNHPFIQFVSNKATWQIENMISLANTLRKLKEDEKSNYPKLIKKLLSTNDCQKEGIPFIEIAASYIKEGFKVAFLNETETAKCPDIELTNSENGEKVFIEVSRLDDDSLERKKINNNYYVLFDLFHFKPPQLPFSCKQLKYVSEEEMPMLLRKISKIKQETYKQESFRYYKDNKIELAIAHPSKHFKLDQWCKENDKRQDFIGLPLNFNESKRIVNNKKIIEEAEQLPAENAGLIYMPLNPLYFGVTDLAKAIALLENQINLFPNLIGLVLYSHVGNEDKSTEYFENMHFYGKKKINKDISQDLLFIFNHKFKINLSENTMKKIYSSFK